MALVLWAVWPWAVPYSLLNCSFLICEMVTIPFMCQTSISLKWQDFHFILLVQVMESPHTASSWFMAPTWPRVFPSLSLCVCGFFSLFFPFHFPCYFLTLLSFGWASFLGRFSSTTSRGGKDEHQQFQTYVHLASPVESPPFSEMIWEDFCWLSSHHVLPSEPITVARAVDSSDWLGAGDGPTR